MIEEVEVVDDDGSAPQDEPLAEGGVQVDAEPMITEPGKLMRIAVMLREVQEEARRAEADDAGRSRLRKVHERALGELCEILSTDLQEELSQFQFDFDGETPSQSELMIAQAQLIGWLEGLFQGIQAAIFNQQHAAQKQLETMRQRALTAGQGGQQPGDRSPGNYL